MAQGGTPGPGCYRVATAANASGASCGPSGRLPQALVQPCSMVRDRVRGDQYRSHRLQAQNGCRGSVVVQTMPISFRNSGLTSPARIRIAM